MTCSGCLRSLFSTVSVAQSFSRWFLSAHSVSVTSTSFMYAAE